MKKKVIQDRKNNMNKGKEIETFGNREGLKLQVVWFSWSAGGRKVE